MNRREFFATSAVSAASVTASAIGTKAAPQPNGTAEGVAVGAIELRKYILKPGPQSERLHDYLKTAFIPSARKIGTGPIGVFELMDAADIPLVYVLIPHKSAAKAVEFPSVMAKSKGHLELGATFWNLEPKDVPYVRVESSLMVPFAGMPKLEPPDTSSPRIFELRTYESHSERAGNKKVEMFNIGEIEIFRRSGLTPVFFGQTVIGAKLPNLTYMLTFSNMAGHDSSWQKFIADPDWKKLSKTPGFTDPEIVSNITKVFLKPTSYSQI